MKLDRKDNIYEKTSSSRRPTKINHPSAKLAGRPCEKNKHIRKTDMHNVFFALFFTVETSSQPSQVFVSSRRAEKDQVWERQSKLDIYKYMHLRTLRELADVSTRSLYYLCNVVMTD